MNAKLILGTERPDDDALAQMRERGGGWACFQNHDLGHRDIGRLQFIQFGPERTFKTPTDRAPDTDSCGLGWRYLFVGVVDLATGDIVDYEPATPAERSTP